MTSTGVSNTLLMTAMAGNAKQGNVKDTGGKNFDQLMQTSQNKTSFMETAASKPDVKKVEQNPQMETKRPDTVQKKLDKKEQNAVFGGRAKRACADDRYQRKDRYSGKGCKKSAW